MYRDIILHDGEKMEKYVLPKEIIRLSEAKTWDRAKQEWELDDIVETEYCEHYCLCGHPIKELCILKNKYNGKEAIVGNFCVKKFLNHIKSDKFFRSISRVRKDISNSFNADFIQKMYDKAIITDWEYNFYMDTWRKRNLNKSQLNKRIEINGKILRSKNLLVDA